MAKVLIADDQPDIRRLWAVNLSARSYEVVEAADGRQCLSMIAQENPDLILLDLSMPVLSGWAVLEAINRGSPPTSAPVIVLTGWADDEIQYRAQVLGATGALVKPFGVEELLSTIRLALRGVCH